MRYIPSNSASSLVSGAFHATRSFVVESELNSAASGKRQRCLSGALYPETFRISLHENIEHFGHDKYIHPEWFFLLRCKVPFLQVILLSIRLVLKLFMNVGL